MAQENITELKDLKPFEQKPYWDSDAIFEISGLEFERLFTIFQPFMAGAYIMQGLMDKAINEGKIKVKYEYTDGSGELSEEEVKALTEQFLKLMQEGKQKEAAEASTEDKVKPLNKIITEI